MTGTSREPGWLDGNYWTGWAYTCDADVLGVVVGVAFVLFWLARVFLTRD